MVFLIKAITRLLGEHQDKYLGIRVTSARTGVSKCNTLGQVEATSYACDH